MRVIVVGGAGLPDQVAAALRNAGDEVTIIEGDPLVPATLEAAGALKADVLAALTPSDEGNLVISLLAKRRFQIPRIVALVNDPANEALFDSSWGVDALVSPATTLVSMIRSAAP
jgi:trk system potassium uptake protein TrkA